MTTTTVKGMIVEKRRERGELLISNRFKPVVNEEKIKSKKMMERVGWY